MNVKDIIWHLDNFVNTWKGWNGVIDGLTKFFEQAFDKNGADGFKGAIKTLSGLSSKK